MDTERNEELIRILREEYGITTLAELDEAIRKLGPVDISPFCAPVPNRRNREYRGDTASFQADAH